VTFAYLCFMRVRSPSTRKVTDMFSKTRFEKEKAPRAWDAGASSRFAGPVGCAIDGNNIARPGRAVKRPRIVKWHHEGARR
jgi:hypothetical protein